MQVGDVWQFCNENNLTTGYPFPSIAQAAANLNPDVVIHVGDYQYRDNECPPDVAGCAGSPWGYGWDTWEADFFAPAQPLLAAAPMVLNRGNHEQCTRAGQGWYRFLDTNQYDGTPGKDCNLSANDNIGSYNAAYGVQLRADTQAIVFDSNNVSKNTITNSGSNAVQWQAYTAELAQAAAIASSPSMFNIWTNHHPILGFAQSGSTTTMGQVALLDVMEAAYPSTLFPPNINMVLHGHTHLFEAIDFSQVSAPSTYPATFVSGNAGTQLDTSLPNPFPSSFTLAAPVSITPVVANIADSPDFGFMLMVYQPADGGNAATWLATEYEPDGVTIRTQCTVQMSGQMSCTNWGFIP
jgi:hypothetical protein